MTVGKIFTTGILGILFLSLLSCDSKDPIGKWDDNIKLSEKEVNVTAEANKVLITTKGTWWWIDEISVNGEHDFDVSDIDTSRENFLIEEDVFIIERRNVNEIHISISKNDSGSERILFIGLQAGDYFDGIWLKQAAN